MVLTLLGAGPGAISSGGGGGSTERAVVGFSNEAGITTAGTYYVPPGGRLQSSSTTFAAVAVKWRGAGTFRNLYVRASTNSWTATASVTLYVNGVAQALTVNLSGTTPVNDQTHSVTVADGDLVAFGLTLPAGSGTVTLTNVTCQFETAGQISTMLVGTAAGGSGSAGAGFYRAAGGALVLYSAAADGSLKALESGTISHLQLYASDTGAATMAVNSYINGATGNQSFTVASGAAGLNEDATHSDALSVGDTFAIQRGASSVSRTTKLVACKYQSSTSKVSMVQAGHDGQVDRSPAYGNLFGGSPFNVFNSSETYSAANAPCDGEISKLTVYVRVNASTADIVVELLIDGVQTGGSVTIPAGTTGFFGPMTGSVAVTQGQTVSVRYTGRSGGNLQIGWVGALFTDTTP